MEDTLGRGYYCCQNETDIILRILKSLQNCSINTDRKRVFIEAYRAISKYLSRNLNAFQLWIDKVEDIVNDKSNGLMQSIRY